VVLRIGPDGISESKVFIHRKKPVWDRDHEVIERKGIGHPDTIADKLASEISRAYSRYTYDNCDGQVLHHQIDKLMVIGGKTEVEWGGGRFVSPVKVVVAGRASGTYMGRSLPVDDIVNQTVVSFFSEKFPLIDVGKDIVVENKLTSNAGPGTIKQSTGSIAHMFDPAKKGEVRGYEKLVANDTSFCLYYSPLSKLENAVLHAERYLNGKDIKNFHPWLGTDIKIMAVRNQGQQDITMCIPQISKYVSSLEEYLDNLNKIGTLIEKYFKNALDSNDVNISINTKDDYEKNNVYLTVSGASLSGDIGVVGRGNRVNGLITSSRPMSMEGTNGKNPRYYSGFIYAILSKLISERLYAVSGEENVVEIISQNGGPLLKPWRINVVCDYNVREVNSVIEQECSKIELITDDFRNGKYSYLS
jgi:S-adenosylmethionine synthetase